jgi:aryl-alcohol dehydrogenase-like predicted oxidoreductase
MTEQPPYSLLVRGIDADVLPVAEQFGMGVLPWLLARRSRSRLGAFMDNGDYPSDVRNLLSDGAIPATWAR